MLQIRSTDWQMTHSFQSTPEDKEPLNKDLSSLPLMQRPQPDPILDAPRYEVQRITDGKKFGAHVEFRVTDKLNDSRIATCYVQENAEFIVAALNVLPSEKGTPLEKRCTKLMGDCLVLLTSLVLTEPHTNAKQKAMLSNLIKRLIGELS